MSHDKTPEPESLVDKVKLHIGSHWLAGTIIKALNGHDARVTELLEANNREVERRRAAERKLADAHAALASAVKLAGEAAEEWDNAPSGMRAGKILLALAGHRPGYRVDADAIQAVLNNK